MPATKARKKKNAPAASANGKKAVNVSAAVRNILKKDENAKPKQISQTLAKRGIKVKPTYVSIIKSKYLAGKGPAAAASPRKGKASQKYELGDLMEAKRFAEQIGGVERAKEVINAIARLK